MTDRAMDVSCLPPEILEHIFKFLDFGGVLVAERVCSSWRCIIARSSLWRSLTVRYESKRTELVAAVRRHGGRIARVEIKGVETAQEAMALLDPLNSLDFLQMTMCRVDLRLIAHVNTLTRLVSLHLRNCYKITGTSDDRDWDFDFKSLRSLRRLCLSDFGLSDRNVGDLIASCDRITLLDIKKIKLEQANAIRLIERNRDDLELLHLYGGEVYDDECIRHAVRCPNVTSLFMLRCHQLTDASLRLIGRMRLTSLILWNNHNFTESGLVRLFSQDDFSRRLKSVSFSKTANMTTQVIQVVAKRCPNLKFLGLYRCPRLLLTTAEERNVKEMFTATEIFYV